MVSVIRRINAAFCISPKFVPYSFPLNGVYRRTIDFTTSTTLTDTGLSYTAQPYTMYRVTGYAEYNTGQPEEVQLEGNGLMLANSKRESGVDYVDITASACYYFRANTTRTVNLKVRYSNASSNRVTLIVEKLG